MKNSRLKITNSKPKFSKTDKKMKMLWFYTATRSTLYANNFSTPMTSLSDSSKKYRTRGRLMIKIGRLLHGLSKRITKDCKLCKPKS